MPAPRGSGNEGGDPMPTTTKRFYIVKTDDQAVVKRVPVSVCATSPRLDLAPEVQTPTCPVETPVQSGGEHDATGRARVAEVVRHAVRRPHLPHLGRPGR